MDESYTEWLAKQHAEWKEKLRARTISRGSMGAPPSVPSGGANKSTPAMPAITEPVGDVFYDLIRQLGYHVPCGACASTRAKMNSLGINGCREHFDELVEEVKTNMQRLIASGALKRTLWTDMQAAIAALREGIDLDVTNPVAGVLRTAIARVEEKK
jgi:hypothetical protein